MENIPVVKLAIVAVSRDCFPQYLSINRLNALVKTIKERYPEDNIYQCSICIVESEIQAEEALKEVINEGCNALCVYLGNFGPEISETLLTQRFNQVVGGPVMFCAAAEENIGVLSSDRGDAFCGLLNASYNLKLRGVKAYIPSSPVGDAEHCATLIHEFIPIARAIIGVKHLKVISFGPRPQNFLACNAPIAQLYNIGAEIEENSELDLFESFNNHKEDSRIDAVASSMADELGEGNQIPEILPKLAQYELTLLDWINDHKGSKEYVTIASKCWPAFQTQFKFVPCYVNSRLSSRGIPVACEVDIYGALSEFIGACLTGESVTLLDINNTVPTELFNAEIKGKYDCTLSDTFMGFHCGNTPCNRLSCATMKYQKIMARSLPIEDTNGTLEGDLAASQVTIYRLQSTPDSHLYAYLAQGEILPVATHSFGSIGIFSIPEMGRFYRYGLIENGFPHHTAVAFSHCGKAMYEVFKYLGAEKIIYNQPKDSLYPMENPFDGK